MAPQKPRQEPLAIVGVAYRFPGSNSADHKLWDLLEKGQSTWGKVPESRFDQDAYAHPDPSRAGSIAAKGGYFLTEDPAAFDAPFFGITPAEASALDPQQRYLLEITYECLESAGVSMNKIRGSNTGCFAGAFLHDYDALSCADILDVPTYSAIGGTGGFLSNRVSWFYDLKGPSFTLDTACSSSLVAFHLACQSVWAGESDQALVAGANMILMPNTWRGLTQLQFLSPDGVCNSFDARANGYARGEGFAVLMIKPIHAAIRDGDCIRAVVRGSASNQNGRTPGITMPSTEAQAALIRTAYEAGGLDFDTTGFFEAHGTGTPIGDPLEFNAIAETLVSKTTRTFPLIVGSIKSNIGHLEGTAGLAGLVKAILCVEKGVIPPIANLETPNPKLRLDDPNLQLATELTPWPSSGIRRASVNSFGAGGSNAHVVIDDAASFLQSHGLKGFHRTITAPSTPFSDSGIGSSDSSEEDVEVFDDKKGTARLFVFSAPEQAGLQRMSSVHAKHLEERIQAGVEDDDNDLLEVVKSQQTSQGFTKIDLEQVADTLCARRSEFEWKSFAVASSATELQGILAKGLPKFPKQPKTAGIAFVFTGQGAQSAGMGLELLQHQVYYQHLSEADAYLRTLGCNWSVLEELKRDEASSKIDDARYAQPLCTILQTGLVDLLSTWGITPKSVVGHSSGEIAAAYASGALSKEQAWKVAYFRGLWSAAITEKHPEMQGSMLAVGLGEEEAAARLAEFNDPEIVIACINSPHSTTLSGPKASITKLRVKLGEEKIFHSTLRVKTAYHSPAMKVIADDYHNSIEDVKPSGESRAVMYSSVTGARVDPSSLDATYWMNNMLNPVKFTAAVDSLLTATSKTRTRRKTKFDVDALVEIGPHSALQGPLKQIAGLEGEKEQAQLSYQSVLQRGRDANKTALDVVGRLWARGHAVNVAKANKPKKNSRALGPVSDLPPYPWNRQEKNRYWHEPLMVTQRRHPKGPRTDLLGVLEDDNANTPQYRNTLRLEESPWLVDHDIQGMIVFPATGFIAMAVEAALREAAPGKTPTSIELRDVIVQRPLLFQDRGKPVETRVCVRPHKMGTRLSGAPWTAVTIFSRSIIDNSWNEHSSCYFVIHYKTDPSEVEGVSEVEREAQMYQEDYRAVKKRCTVESSPGSIYLMAANAGFNYGPLFQNLSQMYSGDYEAVASITIPDTAKSMPKNFEYPHVIHPITLDNALQLVIPALRSSGLTSTMLPTAMESITIDLDIPSQAGSKLLGYAKVKRRGFREVFSTVVLSQGEFEKPLVTIKGLYCQEVAGIMNLSTPNVAQAKHVASEILWKEDTQLLAAAALGDVLAEAVKSAQPAAETVDEQQTAELDGIAGSICKWISSKRSLGNQEFTTAMKQFIDYACSSSTTKTAESVPHFTEELLSSSAAASALNALWESLQTAFAAEQKSPFDASAFNLEVQKVLNTLASSQDLLSYVAELVSLQAFKTPALNILEIGSTGPEIATTLIEKLSDRGQPLQVDRYIFTSAAPKPVWAVDYLKKTAGTTEYHQFDLTESVKDVPVEKGSIDSVVGSNAVSNIDALSKLAKNVYELLKPGGKLSLIITKQTSGAVDLVRAASSVHLQTGSITPASAWLPSNGVEKDQLEDVFRQAGFSGIDALVESQPNTGLDKAVFLTASRPYTPATQTPGDVLILEPAVHDSRVLSFMANIDSGLTKAGFLVSRATLAEAPDTKDKLVICCLDLAEQILNELSASDFAAWKNVLLNHNGLLWISSGAQISSSKNPLSSLATGVLRAVRAEAPHLRLVHFDLSEDVELESPATAQLALNVLETTVFAPDDEEVESELVEKNGRIVIPRLFTHHDANEALHYHRHDPLPSKERLGDSREVLQLSIGSAGMLDSLRFVKSDTFPETLPQGSVKVKVTATPINFVDIMIAMGMVPAMGIGCECAGIVVEAHEGGKFKVGDEVVALTSSTFATYVVEDESMIQAIPAGMTPAGAASCATIYVTAYVALIDVARIQKGETVLIHAGAGGLGQAAIQLCQMIGAEIFVTVGSTAKKALLMEKYGIEDDHVFNSRDLSFAKGIMRQTNQRGVDVILNSTNGEALRQTWHCIAPFGRFLEVGKRDIIMNTGLDMTPFLRNVSYAGVHIDQMVGPHRAKVAEAFTKVFDLLKEGKIGEVHPVTIMTYTELEQAFRMVQAGKHTGKVVLTASDDDVVSVVPKALDPLVLKPDVTYAIGGGLGGVGRSIVDMMYDHGARHFAFFSRSGDSRPEAKAYLELLRARGADARAYAADLGDLDSLSAAIDQLNREMPPIKGLLNSAMNLQDCLFENMTHDQWTKSLAPKVNGSWNFHKILPQDLDFFVLLSSISAIIGNPGQSNYAAANGYQDMLAHYRRSIGLAGTSVNLSAIFGVGHIEENSKQEEVRMKLFDMIAIDETELNALMSSAMKKTTIAGSPMPTQLVTGVNPTVLNVAHVGWAMDPKFNIIRRKGQDCGAGADDESTKSKLLDDLATCETLLAASKAIEEALVLKLSKSMMVNPEDINTQKPLHSFGVDSLVAVEVRNWIFKELKSEVTVFDLMDPQSVSALVYKIAERSKLISDDIKAKAKEDE